MGAVSPRRFLPVSVTGSACALSCDHCQGKVLGGMVSVRAGQDLFALAARLREQGTEGLLVSGGSTRGGGVPLLAHLRHVPRIRQELGMKVIVHSGLVSPDLAEALSASGVDGVMLDVIGADETLREVYHLDLTVADVDRSLRLLSEHGLRTIPHIVLGLHYGRFLGEHRALEMVLALQRLGPGPGGARPAGRHPDGGRAAAPGRRGDRLLRHGPAGRADDHDQPRLCPAARGVKGELDRAAIDLGPQRHRLPG